MNVMKKLSLRNFVKLRKFKACFCSSSQPLHPYLQETLDKLNINHLTDSNKEVFDSVNQMLNKKESSSCIVLSDSYSGKYFSVFLAIMNHIINQQKGANVVASTKNFDSLEFFATVDKIFEKKKSNHAQNQDKKFLKPRGCLVISPKFEFVTQLYKICRKIDSKGILRISRIGTTLQNVSPIVEHLENDTEAHESELEEICKINLLLNTQWQLNDIMLISPVMMEFVMNNLEDFDKFDINPEIILIDDFDALSSKENKSLLKRIIHKYFSINSEFYNENTKSRKLLLTSSTSDVFNDFESFRKINAEISAVKEISLSKQIAQMTTLNIQSTISKMIDLPSFVFQNVFYAPHFMDLAFFRVDRMQNEYLFENCEDGKYDKKFKKLMNILTSSHNATWTRSLIVISSDKVLKQVKEELIKKKIQISAMEKDSKVNERLKSLVEFNSGATNIMIGAATFVKGLNFKNVENLIMFDMPDNYTDYIRFLSKMRMNLDGQKSTCKLK